MSEPAFTYHRSTDPAASEMMIRSAVARPVRLLAVAFKDAPPAIRPDVEPRAERVARRGGAA